VSPFRSGRLRIYWVCARRLRTGSLIKGSESLIRVHGVCVHGVRVLDPFKGPFKGVESFIRVQGVRVLERRIGSTAVQGL
jgi:hypothetical protein